MRLPATQCSQFYGQHREPFMFSHVTSCIMGVHYRWARGITLAAYFKRRLSVFTCSEAFLASIEGGSRLEGAAMMGAKQPLKDLNISTG